MVELRKRKEAPPAPEKPAKKKSGPKSKKDAEKLEDTVEKAGNAVPAAAGDGGATAPGETNGAKSGGPPKAGDTITLKGFGGEVETQDGKPVTLMQLVDESKAGVVLFTYPKASTPGCKSRPSVFIPEICLRVSLQFWIF
jgi:peroxiredoxin Q/BCP